MTPTPQPASPGLRRLLTLETVSFVLLMVVAMPLKYVWDIPLATRIAGSLHGLLFVLAGLGILLEARTKQWPLALVVRAVAWLAVPLGRRPL